MRKKIIVSIILCAIVFSIGIAQAVTGTASLKASNTSVKPGETFTVTLSVTCADGINGIDTSYNYDQTKLELVSANVANNNWANLGVDNSITLISNTTSKITSNDVYVLTFKVKDNVGAGTTSVSTSEIMIDSDLAQDSSFTVAGKSVNINIVSESSNNVGNTNTENSNNVGNTTVTENTNTDTKLNIISQNTTSTDNTMATNSKLPQTGVNSKISIIAIGTVAVAIAIYSFIKIKFINR